jgi:hypothetical protein
MVRFKLIIILNLIVIISGSGIITIHIIIIQWVIRIPGNIPEQVEGTSAGIQKVGRDLPVRIDIIGC